MPFIPLASFERKTSDEILRRARAFYDMTRRRRTVRMFSDESVPPAVIEDCIRAAGTAPSGANLQPWHFCIVADPVIKHEIRVTAEQEEREKDLIKCPECERKLKTSAIVEYRGTLICRRCHMHHLENDKLKVAKVTLTKHKEHDKKTVKTLAIVFLVLAMILVIKMFIFG